MMKPAHIWLYRWLLRLHPPAFRERFAEEMASTFEEAATSQSLLGLFVDCLISLTRQWLLRPNPWRVPVSESVLATATHLPLFAWERINISASGLPARRWMQGSIISLGLFIAVWVTASQAPLRRPAPAALRQSGSAAAPNN